MLALTFQIGANRLAIDVRVVREVIPSVALKPVAGAADWLAGVFVHRGKVVPVVDSFALVGVGRCPAHLSSRIILVPLPNNAEEQLVGILAAKVADVRDIDPTAKPLPMLSGPGRPDLGPVLVDDEGILHVTTIEHLLPQGLRAQLGQVHEKVR